MRANHATEPQEPAPRGVAGARRAVARWLPRPRTLAAGGALLAQLWGLGAPGAYAATAEPPSGQAGPAVRRAPHGAPALDGPSVARPVGPSRPGATGTGRPPGLAGEPTGDGPAGGATTAVGGVLQERIRAGGLPLPGQGAAVPDAFALASGLLGAVPAQGRPTGTRTSREGEPATLPAVPRPRSGSTDQARPAPPETAGTPPVREAAADEGPGRAQPAGTAGAAEGAAAPAVPTGAGTPEALALADTATVTAEEDNAATATAVLAPIAAGLLLTGAAMCKHRGLPRGH
ncbi:hypothetical protein ACIG5E_11280 [Kitasatospora sp. NPDC053057]|uniref:hypothetical protein n=1 Tax=Kitasatospora sp. NPDC053057 TaxID=3364062 RepID=UPI0037C871D4